MTNKLILLLVIALILTTATHAIAFTMPTHPPQDQSYANQR